MSFLESEVKAFGQTQKNLRYLNQYELVKASVLTDTFAVIAILHFDIIATAIISIVVTEGIIIYIITKAIGYPFCMTSSLH